MKWKTIFILVFLTPLFNSKICNAGTKHVSPENYSKESIQGWSPSAVHGVADQENPLHRHTSSSSSSTESSVIAGDEKIGLEREKENSRDENIKKILPKRKFAVRRLTKRHKTGVSSHTGIRPSASPFKKTSTFEPLRPSFITDVPVHRNVKLPTVLTSLPTDDKVAFSSKTNREGAKSAEHDTTEDSNTNNDQSTRDIPKPRVTEHDRRTKSGTDSKEQRPETSAHYEITSPGLRWTAHDLRTGAPNEKRKRYKKKKAASRRTDDVEEDTDDEDGPGDSRSSTILAAVGAGIMVLLLVFAGLARLWSKCKKRCLRRKCLEFGWNFNSLSNLSEELSEEEILFDATSLECGMRTSRDSAKRKAKAANPPSYQLAATHFDAQTPWTLTDTPTSTPLMAVSKASDVFKEKVSCVEVDIPGQNPVSEVPNTCTIVDLSESSPVCVVVDAPQAEFCAVIDIPDFSSPDTSFTCSSLSDAFSFFSGTPQSSSSLTSVSSFDITSEPEASSLMPEPDNLAHCSSLTPNSKEPLKTETELTNDQAVSPTVPEPEVVIDAPSSEPSILLTIESESSLLTAESQTTLESSPLMHPATPKQSSSFDLAASASNESTRTVFLATESSSSSRESCKTPVAPRGDVVLAIEDDEDEVVLRASEKSGTETTILNSEDEKNVTRLMESAASDSSSETTNAALDASCVTGDVQDTSAATAESLIKPDNDSVTLVENAAIGTSGVTEINKGRVGVAQNPEIKITGETNEGVEGMTVVDNAALEISGEIGEENDGVTLVENAVNDISGVTDGDASVAGPHESTEIEITGVTNQSAEGGRVGENAVMEIAGVTSNEIDGVIDVDNATIDLCNVTSEKEDSLTVVKNALMEISGVRSEVKDGLIEFENAVIDLSGDVTEESGVMELDEVIIEISNVTSEGKDGVMVVENASIEISGLTSGDKDFLMMAMGNNHGGSSSAVTLSLEGNKPGVNEIREKELLPSKSRAKGTSSGSKEANEMWDSIYKNRTKLMEKQKKQKKRKGLKPVACESNLTPLGEERGYRDHKTNPQEECWCKYCEKHRQKSRGSRFFKFSRKLMPFKSKSSVKHDRSANDPCASTVPSSDACASTSPTVRNHNILLASNSGLTGEKQIHYLPNKRSRPGVTLPGHVYMHF